MKRITTLIFFLLMSTLTQAAQMLPMIQTFPTEANSVLHGTFHVESTEVRIFAVHVDSSGVAITLPDGTTMAEGNAESLGFDWTYYEDTNTGVRNLNVVSDSAPVGDYSFILTSGPTPARLSVSARPGLNFFSFAGVPGAPIEVGKYFAVAMALGTEDGPALGATITAEILDASGHVISTAALKDDGVSPDETADDSMYTSVASINQVGYYQTRFRIEWNGHQGLIYQPVAVASAGFGLTGGFTVNEVDSNGNGLIEEVELTFEESAPREAGEHELSVAITDLEGGRISSGGRFDDPATPLTAVFSFDDLKKLGAQPWTVAKVGIMKDFRVLGILNDVGTLDIDPGTLERQPMVINGITTDQGVDADDDGLFERLDVEIEVVTQASGYYGVSSDLRSPVQGKLSDNGIPSLYLSKGANKISMSFMGADVGRSGLNGPYQVSNFLIYPNFNTQLKLAKLVNLVGETSYYTCEQFVGCGSDLEAEILRIANTLCGVLGHQIKAKLNRIQSKERSNPDVAERQLQALYNRATNLEKSGACLPAKGWSGDRPLS
ncbi:choice-of-anchor X domain-containing protein [Marinobacter changyiensis]|uniref:choice-of-anchor X domain-containing protein n=1 Tax=Marinobacter changyiensis TaxID=2604091 RepID=UPI0012642457|nr:choice-of-anchor X domain-containing protein [Marinobacter changyiensis]